MSGQISSGTLGVFNLKWPILLARDVDQDLDFDEGLEDDELDQHKPPNRRPLLWIVILLLAVGIVYWALKPDFFMTTGTDSMDQPPSPSIASPIPGQNQPNRATSSSSSSPKFAEGQQVLFSKYAEGNTESLKLKGDASGTKPGPAVKPGELLTIVDGEILGTSWVYKVQKSSGATGWVLENEIRRKT